jgi:hypothetical protein
MGSGWSLVGPSHRGSRAGDGRVGLSQGGSGLPASCLATRGENEGISGCEFVNNAVMGDVCSAFLEGRVPSGSRVATRLPISNLEG